MTQQKPGTTGTHQYPDHQGGVTTPTLTPFRRDLARGQEIERLLDAYLEPTYEIRPATVREQRQGIDRFLTHRETGETFSIDYKADWLAARTGNVFIETVSVDRTGAAGWALSSRADWIFYYLPQRARLYVLSMAEIVSSLPQWALIYRVATAETPGSGSSDGYHSAGVLVPLAEIERVAEAVVEVGK